MHSIHARKRTDIQGLRAIAVVLVIAFHFDHHLLPGGFIGVDIFFVISGYLITQILQRKIRGHKFSLAAFYANRIRRILPAYLLMMLLVGIVSAVFLIKKDLEFFEESYASALFFYSNQYFSEFTDYFSPSSYELPLLHTWSLAIELQFYLIYPLLYLIFSPRQINWVLPILFIISFAISLLMLSRFWVDNVGYYSLLARMPEFLLGAVFASNARIGDFLNRRPMLFSNLGVLLVVVGVLTIEGSKLFPGYIILPCCLGICLILCTRNGYTHRVLSSKPLVFFGGISYSLYLWHWPIFALYRYLLSGYSLGLFHGMIALCLTFLISITSYRYIEKFYLDRVFTYRLALSLLMIMFLAIIVGEQLKKIGSFVYEVPRELTRYERHENICHGKLLESCQRGSLDGDKNILLIGDSHAAQLNYFADAAGVEIGVSFDVISASSCVVLPGFDGSFLKDKFHHACLQQINHVVSLLESQSYNAIVIAGKWSYQLEHSNIREALERFVGLRASHGDIVILLAQPPLINNSPLRLSRMNKIGLANISRLRSVPVEENEWVKRVSQKSPNIYYLDLTQYELFRQAPFSRGELIYMDESHLNELGSRYYGESAAKFLAAIIGD